MATKQLIATMATQQLIETMTTMATHCDHGNLAIIKTMAT
jgi:hypothetical protein